jgi:hypothetical protein
VARKRSSEITTSDNPNTAWWRAPKEQAGKVVTENVMRMASDQSARRVLAQRRLSTYLGRAVGSLSSELYYSRGAAGAETAGDTTQSFAMSAVDTGQAMIASQQRPKGAAITKGGDYYERLEAKKISKFFEGCLQAPQGSYANTWELGEQCFHDCEILEAGAVKVYADLWQKSIVHERVFAHDCYFDPLDAKMGSPKSLHHAFITDKWDLAERFPEYEKAILKSSLDRVHREDVRNSGDNLITVYESWRRGRNGKHFMAVNGSSEPIVFEDYDREMFPIAFLMWQRNTVGGWSTPMVDAIAESQAYANLFLSWMLENARLQCGGTWFYERGSIEPTDLEGNIPGKGVPVKSGTQLPKFDTPQPFHPAFMDLFDRLRGMCFENVGVSEMSSQGKKEQSITSGVAIRTVNALQSQRFLPKSRAYEQFIVNINRLDLYAIQDLVAANIDPSMIVESEGFIDTIDWSEITLPSDQYVVTLAASSSEEDSPAARKQTIQDLIALGYQNIADELVKIPDVEWVTERQSAQRRYMDGVIARYTRFDARKQDVADVIDTPDPIFDLAKASVQMKDGYISAKADGAPEANLMLFRDWLSEADELMAKAQPAPPVDPAAGGPAPPQGGGEPMAPPAMPMDPAAMGMAA